MHSEREEFSCYIVDWQTKISPGCQFLKGRQVIYGWNETQAKNNALQKIKSKSFPEYKNHNHLIVTGIERINN